MVRKYVRKTTNKRKWTEEQIKIAIHSVLSGKSVRAMSKQFNIPHNSLHRRIQLIKTNKAKLDAEEPGKIQTTTFTDEQEEELMDYARTIMERRNGLSVRDFRKIAFEFADQNSIKNRFNERLKMAGQDFVYGFLKRHPDFVLKKRESSTQRKESSTGKKSVENYFANLDKALVEHMFEPHDIFHCGNLPLRCMEVPNNISSMQDKNTQPVGDSLVLRPNKVTVICCANSIGFMLPPLFIFSRSRLKDNLLDHGPLGSAGFATESANLDEFIILRFFGTFYQTHQVLY